MSDKHQCNWEEMDADWNSWETQCGNAFTIMEGTPADNNFKFCPYCGGEINDVGVYDGRLN